MLFKFLLVIFSGNSLAQFRNGRNLEGPIPELCANRIIHNKSPYGQNYFYQWRANLNKLDWLGARNYCRMQCMDTISLESEEKNNWISNIIYEDNITDIWTSGRICDFKGCERPDLLPVEINGWFWTAIFEKLPPTTNRLKNNWSFTGADGKPQPDNREYSWTGRSENCLTIQNNKYHDGIRWHDEICTKRRNFICEDSEELLRYVRYIRPDLNVK